jgi:hypothetical protein
MANTMQFFGTFDGNLEPHTNAILAFTMGKLTKEGWLSDKANNLEDLIKTVRSAHSRKLDLVLAVQASVYKRANFNIDATKVKEVFLGIKIYLPEDQAFKNTIQFYDIERIGKPLPSTKHAKDDSPHKFFIYEFKVGKRLEVT